MYQKVRPYDKERDWRCTVDCGKEMDTDEHINCFTFKNNRMATVTVEAIFGTKAGQLILAFMNNLHCEYKYDFSLDTGIMSLKTTICEWRRDNILPDFINKLKKLEEKQNEQC